MYAEKPKRPGRRATPGEWERYHDAMAFYNQCQGQQRNPQFPPPNGTVGGEPAFVQQHGNRTVGYHGNRNVGKIVTNDGVNAAFVREETGRIIVDEAQDNPYDPYVKHPNRY